MRLTSAVVAALLSVTAADAQVVSPAVDGGRIAGHVITLSADIVTDATVTLGRINDQGMTWQTVVTKTDASGAFGFEQLPEGRYRLWASKPGYTSRQFPDPNAASVRTFDPGPIVDLARDAQVQDVQVVLRRAASIAGRVIRPDGSAAPDVQVQIAFRSGSEREPLLETRTTSRRDGRYEINGLPPGEYLVGALNAPAAQAAETTWYPGVADPEPGSAVTVLEGVNAEGIDIWLTPSRRFSVSGQVSWPVGVTVERLTIDYGDPAGISSGVWYPDDPGGLFTLAGIAPGALTLLARGDSDQGPLLGIASTEVTGDSVDDVRIVVDRPAVIAGRVVYEGNVPASSQATSIVAVQKLLKLSVTSPVPESAVDANGTFEIRGAIGEYDFALDGLASGLRITSVIRNGRPLPMNRIAIAAGETIRGIEIVVGR